MTDAVLPMKTSCAGVGSRRLGLAGRLGFAFHGNTGLALTCNMSEAMNRGELSGGEMFLHMEQHLHRTMPGGL